MYITIKATIWGYLFYGENVRVILSVVLCSLAKMFCKYTAKIESTYLRLRLKCSPCYVHKCNKLDLILIEGSLVVQSFYYALDF